MCDEMKTGRGKVKFFNDTKGYGFLILDDGETEIFVHQTKIKMEGHRTLYENQPIDVTYYKEAKGWKAETVVPDTEWAAENAPRGGGRSGGRGYDRGYGGGGGYDQYGGGDRGYGGGDRGYGGGDRGYGRSGGQYNDYGGGQGHYGGGGYRGGGGYDQGRY